MKKLLLLFALMVFTFACTRPTPAPVVAVPTATALPTYTPYPTYTPQPLATSRPVSAPPTATPYPTYTAYPTYTPYPAFTPTPSYSAPKLLSPADGSEFGRDDTVILKWDAEHSPVKVQIWKEGETPSDEADYGTHGKAVQLDCQYYPGSYQWRVIIVSTASRGPMKSSGGKHLSPPSETRSFSWLSECMCPTPTP